VSSDPRSGAAADRGGVKSAALRLLGPARFEAARSLYRTVSRRELRDPHPLGLKLRAWQHGFHAASAALYGLENVESGLYVSDDQRLSRAETLNTIPAALDHKLLLHSVLAARGIKQAEMLAFASRHGILVDPVGRARYTTHGALAELLVREGGRYIWKPENGRRGQRIVLLEVADGRLVARRGTDTRPFEFPSRGGAVMLLERAVEQHAFWQALSPTSVNTLRVLTMWTPGDPAPFIARAVQRVGTQATLPTDNWSGGGINALVDLETGVLGPGRVNPYKSGREDRPYTHHPETGAQIQGAVLPDWPALADGALAAARCLPHAPYIGWDIAVDVTGAPVVIEGNKNSDMDLLQVHGGLLADPRVRRFYETCGVL